MSTVTDRVERERFAALAQRPTPNPHRAAAQQAIAERVRDARIEALPVGRHRRGSR